MLTGGGVDADSDTVLGLEGKRPLRPLRLSVRTTVRKRDFKNHFHCLLYNMCKINYVTYVFSFT